MIYEFKFPDVGEGIHEGKIVKWHVKEGDEVQVDKTIAEVETDKAVVEIPSPKTGKIVKIDHAEGETIKVGETLAEIEITGTEEEVYAKTESKKESTSVMGDLGATSLGVMKAPSLTASGAVFGGTTQDEDAEQNNQDEQGAKDITKQAIEEEKQKQGSSTAGASAPAAPQGGVNVVKSGFKAQKKYDMFGYIDRMPYDGVRKAVGEHMVKSVFTVPHVTHTDLADVTDLVELRTNEKQAAAEKGIKLTYLPYFIKATVKALKEHPALNASLNEEESTIILKKYYNIGIAVDIENGLMVPVIKGADKKDILSIAKEIEVLAEKARAHKLNKMDMKGGTFSITNIGSARSGWFATPVINFPESAILGTGMIQDMAIPMNGKVEIRKMLPLSVSFDHRILDGAEAARFTNAVKAALENPQELMNE